MTNLRQAATLALDAWDDTMKDLRDLRVAMDAVRTALEQPEQEPVAQPEQEPTCPECKAAVLYECVACSNNNYPPRPEQEPCIGKDPRCPCQDGGACHYKDCGDTKAWPVPQAEPVAWMADTGSVASLNEKEQGYVLKSAFNIPLYTTPPAAQRQWQGLTDEDWDKVGDMPDTFDQGVAWAQARLKERNT